MSRKATRATSSPWAAIPPIRPGYRRWTGRRARRHGRRSDRPAWRPRRTPSPPTRCAPRIPPPRPRQVARADVDGPDAQPGATVTTASATCPAGTRMFGGGYRVTETVAGTGSGLQPQQGYHMRGSYPSTGTGTPPGRGRRQRDERRDLDRPAAGRRPGPRQRQARHHRRPSRSAQRAAGQRRPVELALTDTPDPVIIGEGLTYRLAIAATPVRRPPPRLEGHPRAAGGSRVHLGEHGGACTMRRAP